MNQEEAIAVFAALAQAGRLTVIQALVRAGKTGAPAGELATLVGVAPNTMSVHLRQLQEAGLTLSEREGRSIRYRVNFDRLGALVSFLLEDCCANDPKVLACCLPAQVAEAGRTLQT